MSYNLWYKLVGYEEYVNMDIRLKAIICVIYDHKKCNILVLSWQWFV